MHEVGENGAFMYFLGTDSKANILKRWILTGRSVINDWVEFHSGNWADGIWTGADV